MTTLNADAFARYETAVGNFIDKYSATASLSESSTFTGSINSLIQNGEYSVRSTNSGTKPTVTGMVLVTRNSVTQIFQIFLGSDGLFYTRYTSNGGSRWSNWVTNNASVYDAVQNFTGSINSLSNNGTFSVQASNTGDKPDGLTTGVVRVTRKSNSEVFQLFIGTEGFFYTRYTSDGGSTWTDWRSSASRLSNLNTFTGSLDALVTNGEYNVQESNDGDKPGTTGIVLVFRRTEDQMFQVFFAVDGHFYSRFTANSGTTWTTWRGFVRGDLTTELLSNTVDLRSGLWVNTGELSENWTTFQELQLRISYADGTIRVFPLTVLTLLDQTFEVSQPSFESMEVILFDDDDSSVTINVAPQSDNILWIRVVTDGNRLENVFGINSVATPYKSIAGETIVTSSSVLYQVGSIPLPIDGEGHVEVDVERIPDLVNLARFSISRNTLLSTPAFQHIGAISGWTYAGITTDSVVTGDDLDFTIAGVNYSIVGAYIREDRIWVLVSVNGVAATIPNSATPAVVEFNGRSYVLSPNPNGLVIFIPPGMPNALYRGWTFAGDVDVPSTGPIDAQMYIGSSNGFNTSYRIDKARLRALSSARAPAAATLLNSISFGNFKLGRTSANLPLLADTGNPSADTLTVVNIPEVTNVDTQNQLNNLQTRIASLESWRVSVEQRLSALGG